MNGKIPLPILIYGGLLAAIGLLIGLNGYLNPGASFPSVTLEGAGLQSAYMLAGRNVAMALVLALALILREPRVLAYLFLMRLLTEVQDLFAVIAGGALGLNPWLIGLIWLAIFILPELLCIRLLWPRTAPKAALP